MIMRRATKCLDAMPALRLSSRVASYEIRASTRTFADHDEGRPHAGMRLRDCALLDQLCVQYRRCAKQDCRGAVGPLNNCSHFSWLRQHGPLDKARPKRRAKGNPRIVEVVAVVMDGRACLAVANVDVGSRYLLKHEGE